MSRIGNAICTDHDEEITPHLEGTCDEARLYQQWSEGLLSVEELEARLNELTEKQVNERESEAVTTGATKQSSKRA